MLKTRFRLALVLLVVALGLGWCLVLALRVPLLSMLIGLAAFPLMLAFPPFAQTGEDVEFGFAWLILRSPRAFWAFFLYYSAVCYAILLPLGLVASHWRQQRRLAQQSMRARSGY
jgi:hypothetical protein